MANRIVIKELAATIKARKMIRKAQRRRDRRKSRKCFWTWPWGHIWGNSGGGSSYDRTCVICGEWSCRGRHDGAWKYDVSCYADLHKKGLRNESLLALLEKLTRIHSYKQIVIDGIVVDDGIRQENMSSREKTNG